MILLSKLLLLLLLGRLFIMHWTSWHWFLGWIKIRSLGTIEIVSFLDTDWGSLIWRWYLIYLSQPLIFTLGIFTMSIWFPMIPFRVLIDLKSLTFLLLLRWHPNFLMRWRMWMWCLYLAIVIWVLVMRHQTSAWWESYWIQLLMNNNLVLLLLLIKLCWSCLLLILMLQNLWLLSYIMTCTYSWSWYISSLLIIISSQLMQLLLLLMLLLTWNRFNW